MRKTMIGLMVWMLCAGTVFAQEQRNTAIEGVIQGQIDAFQADDFETAFTFASPMIHGIFGTAQNFGQMVQQGYPMVHHPADVQFLELRDVAGGVWQRVMIKDASGRLHFLDYQMIPAEDGWQINAVQLLTAPAVGA